MSGRPILRHIPTLRAILGLLLLVGAIAGWINNASRSSTGDITNSGDVNPSDLRVGDCWDEQDPTAPAIDNVTVRPCGEWHKYELFYVKPMPAGNYPTMTQFRTYVDSNCLPAFETYVGKAYSDSNLDILWIYPSSRRWTGGDRMFECSAYNPNVERLTVSVKGSAQ